jgi:hypothetical protein
MVAVVVLTNVKLLRYTHPHCGSSFANLWLAIESLV